MNYRKLLNVSILSLLFLGNFLYAEKSSVIQRTKIYGDIDYELEVSKQDTLSEAEFSIGTKTKINETYKFITKLSYNNTYQKLGSNDNEFYLENLYVNIKHNSFSANVGRLNILGPISDDAYADGMSASLGIHDFNIVGAYFIKNSIDDIKENNIIQVEISKQINIFDLYYSYSYVYQYLSSHSGAINAKIGPAKFRTMYTITNYKNENTLINKGSIGQAYLDIKYAYFIAGLSFAISGDKPNSATLDQSPDAPANYRIWQLDLRDKADSHIYGASLRARLIPKVDFKVTYAGGTIQNFRDAEELLGEVFFKQYKYLDIILRASKYTESSSILVDNLPVNFETDYYRAGIEMNFKF